MKTFFYLNIMLFSLLHSSVIIDLKINNKDIDKIKTSKERSFIVKRLYNFHILKKDLQNEKNKLIILTKVNNFFNKFLSLSDIKNYNKIDYWANRKEFIIKGKGDCEDYVIAKYFTLLELGLKKEYFTIYQVKYKNDLHLVLAYKIKEKNLVLDNINKKIKDMKNRNDLTILRYIKTNNLNNKNYDNNIIYYKWNRLLKRI